MNASCPVCGKRADTAIAPFCSPRCADVDLGRWLSGVYVVAGGDTEGADAEDRVAAASLIDPDR